MSYDSQLKEIVRTFYESYNKRDLAASRDRYISLQLVMHVPGYDDRDSWLVMDNEILAAFEDLTLTVFDQVETGEFLGIPASGRYASFTATTVDRVYGGKIIEHWADSDLTAFLRQLTA